MLESADGEGTSCRISVHRISGDDVLSDYLVAPGDTLLKLHQAVDEAFGCISGVRCRLLLGETPLDRSVSAAAACLVEGSQLLAVAEVDPAFFGQWYRGDPFQLKWTLRPDCSISRANDGSIHFEGEAPDGCWMSGSLQLQLQGLAGHLLSDEGTSSASLRVRLSNGPGSSPECSAAEALNVVTSFKMHGEIEWGPDLHHWGWTEAALGLWGDFYGDFYREPDDVIRSAMPALGADHELGFDPFFRLDVLACSGELPPLSKRSPEVLGASILQFIDCHVAPPPFPPPVARPPFPPPATGPSKSRAPRKRPGKKVRGWAHRVLGQRGR